MTEFKEGDEKQRAHYHETTLKFNPATYTGSHIVGKESYEKPNSKNPSFITYYNGERHE